MSRSLWEVGIVCVVTVPIPIPIYRHVNAKYPHGALDFDLWTVGMAPSLSLPVAVCLLM